ncbi:dual specificity tyrosine-phosphorylation-regulated kinase 4-like [Centroberyx affinis]|uniref:dual specificity tyrosine-phosphorylation-regulated kinase 4-like n=1 Tax=Centroberyx affinis TaxID=166261 RepID=UPI003A5BEA9C
MNFSDLIDISSKHVSKKPEKLLKRRDNAQPNKLPTAKPAAHPQRFKHQAEGIQQGFSRVKQPNTVTKRVTLPPLVLKSAAVNPPKLPQQLDAVLPQIRKSRPKTPHHGGLQQQEREQSGQVFAKESLEDSKQKADKGRSSDGRLAMSTAYVLKTYRKHLTVFEREEIKDYTQVWYLGMNAKKIQGSRSFPRNSGYDDEDGYYRMVLKDHLAYRFEVLELIGEGTYGQVLKCRDHKTMEIVALKVIRNQDSFHHEAVAEVEILDALRKMDKNNTANILHMKEHFYFRSHLCISFELMGKDLHEKIKESNFKGFGISEVRRYATDLLNCLQMLKEEGVIHCDLKPENILLSNKDHEPVKVIDFGASSFEHDKAYPCVQTLFYMSPEVLLGKDYSAAVDMWSFGCILAELCMGSRLFPGTDMENQLYCIMEVLGIPPKEFLRTAPKMDKYFDSKGMPRNHVNSFSLAELLNTKDANFLDFLQRCLKYDPEKRMTPEEALQHPWIKEQHHHLAKTCAASRPAARSAATALFSGKEGSLLKREKMPAVRLQPIGERVITSKVGNRRAVWWHCADGLVNGAWTGGTFTLVFVIPPGVTAFHGVFQLLPTTCSGFPSSQQRATLQPPSAPPTPPDL